MKEDEMEAVGDREMCAFALEEGASEGASEGGGGDTATVAGAVSSGEESGRGDG